MCAVNIDTYFKIKTVDIKKKKMLSISNTLI